MKKFQSRFVVGVALVCLLGGVGCGETVNFNVLRAARVNVKGLAGEGKDATVSVGTWGGVDGSAAEDIKQRIRELVTNAEGGIVKFADASGIVRLDGQVGEHRFSEEVTQQQQQCTRYDDKGKAVQYPCTLFTRTGTARLRASMNVVDQSGKTVASDAYQDGVVERQTATDQQPPSIDSGAMFQALHAQAAAHLAALVVPHRVVVSKPWFKCGDANDTCKGGLVQLQQGNFKEAQEIFKRAIDQLKALPKPDTKAQAAAWWGLTLAQEFNGEHAPARASIKEAIQLNPEEAAYAGEKASIDREEKNAKQLAKQGVGGE